MMTEPRQSFNNLFLLLDKILAIDQIENKEIAHL